MHPPRGGHRLALLLAMVLLLGACTGTTSDDASPLVTDESTPADGADAGGDGDEADDSSTSLTIVGEDDAMGEDDDEASSTTTPGTLFDPDTEPTERPLPTVDVPEGVPGDAGAELSAALVNASELQFNLPYLYVRVEQECDGCAPAADLYFVPDEDDLSRHRLDKVWVGDSETSLFEAAPSLQANDPLFIAEELLSAIDGGAEVGYRIDPVSGLVQEWTIDGAAVAIRCFQPDMAPVEQRDFHCSGSRMG